MLKRIAQALWGKFKDREELVRFGTLAILFGLIIGTYWALRPIKDSVFGVVVGKDWLFLAKVFSLFVNVPLVMFYTALINKFQRQRVFYGLTVAYGLATIAFGIAFMMPAYELSSPVASEFNLIGWAWYAFVESFGSLVIALFWSITTDITSPEAAKRGFPLIALVAQLGNIAGPYFLRAKRLGFATSAPVIMILGGLMFVMAFIMYSFMSRIPASELEGYNAGNVESTEEEPGFFEGLKLIAKEKYLLGIAFIIAVYELIITVIDNHFKMLVYAQHSKDMLVNGVMKTVVNEPAAADYLGDYAVAVGVVASLCVLLGINNITRKLGMTASLTLLPILVGIAMWVIKLNPASLIVAAIVMAASKAINYALNQPTLKQLYIPTSKDAKYKSQAWIEAFGSRTAKMSGSLFAGLRKKMALPVFLTLSTGLTMGFVGIWVLVAIYVAGTYNKAVQEDTIVC